NAPHEQTLQLQLTDLFGRVVFKKQINPPFSNRFQLSLPEGIYIATVSAPGSMLSKKVLVQ
ncbi:MAG: T9SS type A sorting domain-containing protein, partial [Bacteroidales bacterium]|nr:T9SS type A sorting domain-containing protein [Bacteroidales bacterium]